MIILIPFPVLLQARLPLKKKAILIGVFALGMFTVGRTWNVPHSGSDGPSGSWASVTDVQPLPLDSLRHPQQVLQLQRALRLRLDVLVHTRVLDGHHHDEPAVHVAPVPGRLPPEVLQRQVVGPAHERGDTVSVAQRVRWRVRKRAQRARQPAHAVGEPGGDQPELPDPAQDLPAAGNPRQDRDSQPRQGHDPPFGQHQQQKLVRHRLGHRQYRHHDRQRTPAQRCRRWCARWRLAVT